jgi:hypothetical protein
VISPNCGRAGPSNQSLYKGDFGGLAHKITTGAVAQIVTLASATDDYPLAGKCLPKLTKELHA